MESTEMTDKMREEFETSQQLPYGVAWREDNYYALDTATTVAYHAAMHYRDAWEVWQDCAEQKNREIAELRAKIREADEQIPAAYRCEWPHSGGDNYPEGVSVVLLERDDAEGEKDFQVALKNNFNMKKFYTSPPITSQREKELLSALGRAQIVLSDYALSNPKYLYRGEWQDPNGVHAMLAEIKQLRGEK
jgi:hypothetical protein